MSDLRCSKPDLKRFPKAFPYARDGRSKALTQASFSSRLQRRSVSVRGSCQLPDSKTRRRIFRTDTDTGTDTSLVRKDHPRTNLIGHQTIDPLTSQRPEHRSSFVFAAGKRDDRLF